MKYFAIRSFDNYIPANITLLRMKNEGIDCYLQDENTITIDPLLSPAIGGMKLMINEQHKAKAAAILNQIEEEYIKSLHCPKCNAQSIQKLVNTSQPKNLFSAILFQLTSGSVTDDKIFFRCSNCGYMMEELPEEGFK